MHNIDAFILEAAKETYDLEAAFQFDGRAFESTILHVMEMVEENVIDDIIERIRETADDMWDDENPSVEGIASLVLFADELDAEIAERIDSTVDPW